MLDQILTTLYVDWPLHRAIRRLIDPSPAVRQEARSVLMLARPHCLRPLRRVAFRQRSFLAVHAAALLYEMGDAQGLYALLAQYSDRSLRLWYGQAIREALQKVGDTQILHVLEVALDEIESTPLFREHWCLSLAVYALNALGSLNASVPLETWRRALLAYSPGFEDLRVCRGLTPFSENGRLFQLSPENNWRIGSTLVAVRSAAIEALLLLDREQAFDLLRVAIAHSEPEVQLTALYGLRHLHDPRSLVLLQPIAADRRHPLAREARSAIETFGTRLPDALTLVRAATSKESLQEALSDELLRPVEERDDCDPSTLLRVPENQ